ncbi:uncharacterized protein N7483_010942 [Penicillium malachiteum]|uniref:uncharacterized protein n=1 Tax=Penicillium malachiteum TaxID=1324776 RepID=UPI002547FE6F|nr:uncharacterized protein N7483_010942 [Penicillium malachiteum]KAJ5713761.1 hypothetical protein N7483_010942 [Penicillium malachiteum]
MEDPSPSLSGTPAPYGRACVNCSRAKSKCILLATGGGCESSRVSLDHRCQRLKKDCRPSPMVRKRNGRSTASKTAQLEAKLDSIVSLLQTNGPSSGLPLDWELNTPGSKQPSPVNPHPHSGCGGTMPSPPSTVSTPNSNSIMNVCNTIIMPPERAEQTIHEFRRRNLKVLPFLHIPPHVTSQQLRQDKPFLWLCIMAVSTPGYNQREKLFSKITELVFHEIFIEVAPSIDILQGIMTFISWTTYSKRPFLNFYVHVVMGIVCDMGINKALPKDLSTMQAFKSATGYRQQNSTTRTLEERRAALGCFLITSSVALSMSRIDALRWNPHMEESLTVLSEAKECPEDEILVTLVKIQLIMDKVYHSRRDGEDQTVSRIYVKSFQSQLDSIRKQIPQHLLQEDTVMMYLENAELVIHEWAIQTPALPHSPELQRLESLCAALHATKRWLDIWLSIPPELYYGLPFTMFFQFSRALMSLFKLSTLEDPSWDRNVVRNTANVLEILDQIHFNMNKTAEMVVAANDQDLSIFEKGVKMITSIKQGWEPKLMEVWYPSLPPSGLSGTGDEFVPPAPDLSNLMSLNGLDDAWMMEIFGSM